MVITYAYGAAQSHSPLLITVTVPIVFPFCHHFLTGDHSSEDDSLSDQWYSDYWFFRTYSFLFVLSALNGNNDRVYLTLWIGTEIIINLSIYFYCLYVVALE